MLSDAKSRQRPTTQRNECEKHDDQTVSIMHCICDRDVPFALRLYDNAINQIDTDTTENLAGHQTILWWLFLRLGGYALADDQQPSPILGWADVAKCQPEMIDVDAERYASASHWLPFDILR